MYLCKLNSPFFFNKIDTIFLHYLAKKQNIFIHIKSKNNKIFSYTLPQTAKKNLWFSKLNSANISNLDFPINSDPEVS